MPSYDGVGFSPPAPTSSVTLHDPRTGATVSGVILLLDSGADVSLLPRAAVERLGVSPEADDRCELMDFDGTRRFATVASLDVIFLRRAFRGRYALIEGDPGVLGRDVLNRLALSFDGPRLEWLQRSP